MVAITTVGESLYWSYANLAMAHAALSQNAEVYTQVHFIIRSRLYSGLQKGTMDLGSLSEDERLKMILPQACSYCGSRQHLSIDHLISRKKGGADRGENMVWACRICNSSKGATDLLEWFARKDEFPPLFLLRRYLKIAIEFCREKEIMNMTRSETKDLPFSLNAIPYQFPKPTELRFWVIPLESPKT